MFKTSPKIKYEWSLSIAIKMPLSNWTQFLTHKMLNKLENYPQLLFNYRDTEKTHSKITVYIVPLCTNRSSESCGFIYSTHDIEVIEKCYNMLKFGKKLRFFFVVWKKFISLKSWCKNGIKTSISNWWSAYHNLWGRPFDWSIVSAVWYLYRHKIMISAWRNAMFVRTKAPNSEEIDKTKRRFKLSVSIEGDESSRNGDSLCKNHKIISENLNVLFTNHFGKWRVFRNIRKYSVQLGTCHRWLERETELFVYLHSFCYLCGGN